jgi:hypothetical protein
MVLTNEQKIVIENGVKGATSKEELEEGSNSRESGKKRN